MISIITGDWSSYELLKLWFCGTITEEQSASKTEKQIDHGNFLSQKRGSVAVYPRSLRAYRKKSTSPDYLKIKRNCIETLDFFIFIHIILLQQYFNALPCFWYVSKTYHSLVKIHVTSFYFLRSTPVYWSRLGRLINGTNTYVPISYTRLGVNICSARFPSLPIWWRHYKFNQSDVFLSCVKLDEHGTST